MFYLNLFTDYLKQYLKTKMVYRMDFVNEVISNFIFQIVNLVFILVVFQHTSFIQGWSRDEIIFIYGYFLIPYAFYSTFFNLWDFQERYIIRGEMDRILTRPAHNLFQVMLENMEPESLAGAVTGFIIMGYAAYHLDLQIAWYDPFMFILLVVSGMFIYGGVYTAIAAIGFFSDSKTGLSPMIFNIQNYGRYPVDIYNKTIRFLLTWILPFAFVGVYPSSFFLKREELYYYVWLTPVMAILFFSIGLYVWNLGVRHYKGAGS